MVAFLTFLIEVFRLRFGSYLGAPGIIKVDFPFLLLCE